MNISVVIPIFNELESLPELKGQLLENLQSFEKWEIIFIDDGSSDGSTEWLTDLASKDRKIILIVGDIGYGIFDEFRKNNPKSRLLTKEYVTMMYYCVIGDPYLAVKGPQNLSLQFLKDINNKFQNNSKYNFDVYNKNYVNNEKYELSLSLDVIYHILDDNEYKKYMEDLFNFSNKYVIIYSNNYSGHKCGHMYTKIFTKDIKNWFSNYKLKQFIKQKYPEQSSADFYIYEKS